LGRFTIIDRFGRAVAGRRSRVFATAVLVTFVFAGLAASTATAARGLMTGFTDNSIFDPSAPNPSIRGAWLDRVRDSHARIVRITVDWRNTVGRVPPEHPGDPTDPAYGFARLDAAVRAAKARSLEVMLTVYRAPGWAEDGNPPRHIEPGAWKPNPEKYGQFALALARRYSGGFRGLPRVHFFEAWTEPNLTQFLAPQWIGKKPEAHSRYRAMLNRFYEGIHSVQRHATVIAGATSPFGDSRRHPVNPQRPRMRPIAFLRTALCLNAKLKKTRCDNPAHLDAVSAHPLNTENGPHYKPRNKDDSQVANFGRVALVTRAAERAGTVVPGGRHPLWVTEEGMLSNPPNPSGVRPITHARWLEESLYLLWKQGASVVMNLQIRDVAYDRRHVPSGQWTTGVYFRNGKPKPALRAWRFPFVIHRKSKRQVSAWGKAPVSGKLRIQQKLRRHWRTRKAITVNAGQVFTTPFKLKGEATLRAQVGKAKSLTWRQSG